jgi:hypothetical protein
MIRFRVAGALAGAFLAAVALTSTADASTLPVASQAAGIQQQIKPQDNVRWTTIR